MSVTEREASANHRRRLARSQQSLSANRAPVTLPTLQRIYSRACFSSETKLEFVAHFADGQTLTWPMSRAARALLLSDLAESFIAEAGARP
ncbi:MAG TPA: hypothetical protein VKR31_10380 [Rhizomicrobium sp.]|nr:hypothetical protein [Rhizomicrobium sp.]